MPANPDHKPPEKNKSKLVEELEAADVPFNGTRSTGWTALLLAWAVPIVLLVMLWIFLGRKIGAAGESMPSVGRSRAKLVADRDTGVSFEDVAGCDEAKFELQEVIEFLKNPADVFQ